MVSISARALMLVVQLADYLVDWLDYWMVELTANPLVVLTAHVLEHN